MLAGQLDETSVLNMRRGSLELTESIQQNKRSNSVSLNIKICLTLELQPLVLKEIYLWLMHCFKKLLKMEKLFLFSYS